MDQEKALGKTKVEVAVRLQRRREKDDK